MQTASSQFAAAVSASTVSWLPPQVYADWAENGYGAANSIDDLSGQAGTITVRHALNDGLPDEVSFVADSAVPEASVELAGRGENTAAWYFSPFQTSSPLYGYDRDVAPTKVDHGLVTSAGKERIRIFTGVMEDAPVRGGRASLEAISSTRRTLAQFVQPPVRESFYRNGPFHYGLTASWPVTYTLHTCGIYPSPPTQSGCRLWVPLHGGGNPYLPATNPLLSNPTGILYGRQRRSFDAAFTTDYDPTSIRGPYVGGAYAAISVNLTQMLYGSIGSFSEDLEAGSDWLTQTSSKGRLQFWLRGDSSSTINTSPGGSAAFAWGPTGTGFIAGAEFRNGNGTYVVAGVDLNRKVFVRVNDGVHNTTLTASAGLATDGAWHFVGAAWDVASQKLWVRHDSITETSTPTLSAGGLPTSQIDFESDSIILAFALPVAELQFSTGTSASPDVTTTWLNNMTWTQGAYVYPSGLGLEVVAEKTPREAWEYIASFAQAELASIRIDENDAFVYRPRGYWATVAGQTTAQTVTTATDAELPDVKLDPSRIRNTARVSYDQTWVDSVSDLVLSFRSVISIPPGATTLTIALDTPAVRLLAGTLTHLTSAQISGSDTSPPGWSFITLNTTVDGSGTYSTASDVAVTASSWTAGEVVIDFTNTTGTTWYLVNNSNTTGTDFPYIGIYGSAITATQTSVTEQYDASVVARGTRVIALDLPTIQRESDAIRVARRIVGDFAYAVPVIDKVEVFGDPRRQPGDLVTFVDDEQTGISASWRSYSVEHNLQGAEYTQTLRLQKAQLVGRWGDGVSRWGRCVWAGQEVT